MDKNSKVKAGVAKSETFREKTEKEKKEIKASAPPKRPAYTMQSDRLANDSFHLKNQPIPGGDKMFPNQWKMQYVDIYYPYAKDQDGKTVALYIDMPVTEVEVASCRLKKDLMSKQGLRYTFIQAGHDEIEALAIMETKA